MSAHERTGWRDTDLSNRHRLWGKNVPATDIDFVEYDNSAPKSIFEWKHEGSQFLRDDTTTTVKRIIADKCGIPFFMVVRDSMMTCFYVHAKNIFARNFLENYGIKESIYKIEGEDNFVCFLYNTRGREAPDAILSYIRNNPFKPTSKLDVVKNMWSKLSNPEKDEFKSLYF